jgi:hypothetical protein
MVAFQNDLVMKTGSDSVENRVYGVGILRPPVSIDGMGYEEMWNMLFYVPVSKSSLKIRVSPDSYLDYPHIQINYNQKYESVPFIVTVKNTGFYVGVSTHRRRYIGDLCDKSVEDRVVLVSYDNPKCEFVLHTDNTLLNCRTIEQRDYSSDENEDKQNI